MDETAGAGQQVRRVVRTAGRQVSLVADVHVVAGGTTSSRQHVRVRQGRSAGPAPDPDQKEQS